MVTRAPAAPRRARFAPADARPLHRDRKVPFAYSGRVGESTVHGDYAHAPSPEDIVLTERLVAGAVVLGIKIIDHVIIGASTHFSFLDAGIMQRPRTT